MNASPIAFAVDIERACGATIAREPGLPCALERLLRHGRWSDENGAMLDLTAEQRDEIMSAILGVWRCSGHWSCGDPEKSAEIISMMRCRGWEYEPGS